MLASSSAWLPGERPRLNKSGKCGHGSAEESIGRLPGALARQTPLPTTGKPAFFYSVFPVRECESFLPPLLRQLSYVSFRVPTDLVGTFVGRIRLSTPLLVCLGHPFNLCFHRSWLPRLPTVLLHPVFVPTFPPSGDVYIHTHGMSVCYGVHIYHIRI